MRYKMVVFDLAGTTVNDNQDVHRVLKWALRKHGVSITIEQANDVMGIPKPVAIRQLLLDHYTGERIINNEWISEIHADFIEEMISFYRNDSDVTEKPHVTETFQQLKANGIKVVVDTGFDRKITNALLERLGWEQNCLIDYSVTSDEVDRGRPFPDMIYKAMRNFGIESASEVVKVGDTVSDIQEGRAAGCGLVVGVTTGAFTADQLSVEKPDHLIHEVSELLSILDPQPVVGKLN